MHKPTPPRYEEFGLTRISYRTAPQPRLLNLDINSIRSLTLAWLWMAGILFAYWTDWFTNFRIWFAKLFYALMCAIVFVVLFVMLVFYPLQALEKAIYQLVSPSYRRKTRYDEAYKKYNEEERKYEDWQHRQAGDEENNNNRLLARKSQFKPRPTPANSPTGRGYV